MFVQLVGADYEENLGIGMIAAAAEAAGHRVEVVPFNEPEQLERVAQHIATASPDLVGLGMQFQHRSRDFLRIAARLRQLGFAGHITAGGHYASAAYREALAGKHGLDTVVLHEGEQTIVELLSAIGGSRSLTTVRGLAIRQPRENEPDGVLRTPGRCLTASLDELPFPHRYRAHGKHVGLPFIPIVGSRGCWGACSFCSITTFYKNARRDGGGRSFRLRSPDNVAQEMAVLTHAAGSQSAIFCFHDDNFLLPRPEDSLARVRALREALDKYAVGKVALIGKCRPDSLTPELARQLRALGVVRLYVGIENTSVAGAKHLERRVDVRQMGAALDACKAAGIFACYNLLIFEPRATLDDVAQNIAFIRAHADQPINFCRAEPYYGTPLYEQLRQAGALGGSYLGQDYRIVDDRTELMFRICAAAFRERNFAGQGVHNRYMGLGYLAALLSQFYGEQAPRQCAELGREARRLTAEIATESAGYLEQAWELARGADLADHDRICRETALLGLAISEADRYQHARLNALYRQMNQVADGLEPPPQPRFSRLRQAASRLARGVAAATLLSAWGVGTSGCDSKRPVATDGGVDSGRRDDMVVDQLPPDQGADYPIADPLPADQGVDYPPPDPPPPDQGIDYPVADPPPYDQGIDYPVVDIVPPPDQGIEYPLPDPPPPPYDFRVELPLDPADGANQALARGGVGASSVESPLEQGRSGPGDSTQDSTSYYRDTSPRQARRSTDLPLFDPPAVTLSYNACGDGALEVSVRGLATAASLRWASDGAIDGDGETVLWRPESGADQLRLGVRTRGGVTIVSLLAADLRPKTA